jgi:hypothetical protein
MEHAADACELLQYQFPHKDFTKIIPSKLEFLVFVIYKSDNFHWFKFMSGLLSMSRFVKHF